MAAQGCAAAGETCGLYFLTVAAACVGWAGWVCACVCSALRQLLPPALQARLRGQAKTQPHNKQQHRRSTWHLSQALFLFTLLSCDVMCCAVLHYAVSCTGCSCAGGVPAHDCPQDPDVGSVCRGGLQSVSKGSDGPGPARVCARLHAVHQPLCTACG